MSFKQKDNASLTNLLPGGLLQVLYDDYFTIMYANPAFYKMFGLTKEKFVTKYEHKIKNVLLKSDWRYVCERIENAKNTNKPFFEITLTLPAYSGKQSVYIIRGVFSEIHSNTILNCIVLNVSKEVFALKAQKRAENILNIALANSDVVVWEWNAITGECFIAENAPLSFFDKAAFKNLPESFIQAGFVTPSSVSVFRDLHEKIKHSKVALQQDVLLCIHAKEIWVRISYTPISNAENSVGSFIGVAKVITRQKQAEIQYNRAMKFQFAALDDVLVYFEYNVSKDKLLLFKSNSNDIYLPKKNGTELVSELIINMMIKNAFSKEDAINIQNLFSKKNLIKVWESKDKVVRLEYRRKTKEGEIIWVKATCRFLEDPATHEITAYGVLKNIDTQKRVELSLRSRAERDKISGFYNQETVSAVVNEMIHNEIEPNKECAFLLFDIDNYLSLMNSNPYESCKEVLQEMAQILDSKFSGLKIAGRIEGDEFVIFLYDNPSYERVLTITEDIRMTISMPYLFSDFSVTISCGIVFSKSAGQSYESLLQCAQKALRIAKKNGKNKIEIYQPEKQVDTNQESKSLLDDKRCPIVDMDEKDILLKIALMLSKSSDLEKVLPSILMSIANYCKASDSFLLEMDDACKKLAHSYFWESSVIPPAKKRCKSKDFTKLLSKEILSVFKEDLIFSVADISVLQKMVPEEYIVFKKWNIESFILLAITRNDKICGLIGINNPDWSNINTHFLHMIEFYISNELTKERIVQYQKYLTQHDILTGFLTRDSYEKYKSRFSGDSVISLGFIYCQINGLKDLNHQYGHVYGDSLILFVTDMIKKLFANNRLFRYSGDSFVVVAENVQSDSFYSKIVELKAEANKTFGNIILVGYSWEDYEININDLFMHASESLFHNMQVLQQNKDLKKGSHYETALKNLKQEINSKKYEVFLQPKVSCITGKVNGAEALIRYYDKEGKLVRPDSFIPFFETEGLISEIDLFVFEEVHKILDSWIQKDKLSYPISLNFSRETIMNESLFEQMQKIESKYSVPRKYVEIEITETVGTIDEDLLIRIGNKISSLGFSLTLDDFGARYSNLSILTSLPFNVLKLDKTLVRDIFFNPRTKVVVQSFLTTCKNLNISSIAEGVESQDQFDILKNMGCDSIQGYLINKPISIKDFEKKYVFN